MLDKISHKITAIKDDIAGAVKERSRSISFDRHLSSMANADSSCQDESTPTPKRMTHLLKTSGNAGSSLSLGPSTRQLNDQSPSHKSSTGVKPSPLSSFSLSPANSSQLINSNASIPSLFSTLRHSQQKLASIEDVSTPTDESSNKTDPNEMTTKQINILVPQDSVKRSALHLGGPKFRVNSKELPKNKSIIHSNMTFSVPITVGIISLVITLWKPISSYLSGFIVGCLFALALVYIRIRMIIKSKVKEIVVEEWIDFPTLDSLLAKIDKEDKNTNIRVTGAYMSFQSYNADRDEDFVRYPCDVRLDGYRLIIQLASKQWTDEKKSEKETKFLGYREYLVKEARMILVPELTLTRAKYWMNDYPIVIRNLQILDKQIFNKQQIEKAKGLVNDFFTNNATIISIWFETGPQKEEWFHKLSLVLRKGKEDIQRTNHLLASSSGSQSSLNRRYTQTESEPELPSNSVIDAQIIADELQQKTKKNDADKDNTGTHRTIARKSAESIPNETCLTKVLQTPECLDEAAITINFLTRRLLCDMFDTSILKDLLKEKIEMKLRELAVSILENLRVVSIDLGNTFPIILKIEPMQWNTQGIWFNLFLYYRGSFKLSVRTRVVLQKLINYDPKKDKPIFAQHQSAQNVRKDDDNDLIQRQKLLAKEPEIPEMAVTRKLGTALTNLALNKYFQFFANIPFVKNLFQKFSEQEVGADVEVTSFSGVLTLNIPPPPSDRIWVGCPEMPDLNIKVTPTYGEKQYSYTLLQDFLSAKIRSELKRLIVLPAMDDQLLPFFRDWAIDVIGEIVSKPVNPFTDDYKAKLNVHTAVREGLQEYKNARNMARPTTISSLFPES
ncbi:unnamed protein product [Adineta ricciae]|uniref:SMP-LTD domain-containing protein n=1 Tax=Adineta ricciae TaxID=249248 RepID=A0A814FS58_ADIRI|nr:unnamed protein product [Adineta ricciae]CAF0987542.1 unnamed protein product [Adineta ricciae]